MEAELSLWSLPGHTLALDPEGRAWSRGRPAHDPCPHRADAVTFIRKARLLPRPKKELIVPSLCQLRCDGKCGVSVRGRGSSGSLSC